MILFVDSVAQLMSMTHICYWCDSAEIHINIIILIHLPIGKFQLQVLAGCGHSIHEDLPDKVRQLFQCIEI